MKKIVTNILIITLLVACGDSDSEDFDPTRIDIVTGMLLTTPQGTISELWGNPNLPTNPRSNIFPKPATGTIRVITNSQIKNIWLISGFPSRRFVNTDFQEVFAENPYQVGEIEANSIRSLANLNATDINLNLDGLSEGYYRIFIQFQDDSLTWDNFYVDTSGSVNLTDINFWDN